MIDRCDGISETVDLFGGLAVAFPEQVHLGLVLLDYGPRYYALLIVHGSQDIRLQNIGLDGGKDLFFQIGSGDGMSWAEYDGS